MYDYKVPAVYILMCTRVSYLGTLLKKMILCHISCHKVKGLATYEHSSSAYLDSAIFIAETYLILRKHYHDVRWNNIYDYDIFKILSLCVINIPR